jgi:hypothetical protein
MNITCESLQTGRKLCKLIVPKIAVADPCRDHQNVVRVRNILMVLATSVDELGVFLDCINFAKKYGCVSLIFQESADGRRDLGRR